MNLRTPLFLAFASLLPATAGLAQVQWVDPRIGGIGHLLEPTRPTVSLPNCMVRVYPVTRDAADDQVRSFPLTIISHRLGELFWFMPDLGAGGDGWERPATFDQEKTTPYLYSARLEDSGVQVSFTPAAQAGYFRLVFPAGRVAGARLANRRPGELSLDAGGAVSGIERFNGMAAYFYGEFSQPMTSRSVPGGEGGRLVFSARQPGGAVLDFRYGISFISVQQARRNLREEIPDWTFDRVRDAARARWNDTLGQVQVTGGTDAQKRVFYTALYRCYERMVSITEDGRYFSASDHQVHEDPRPFYVDNWIWDLYQAHQPLMELLDPKREGDEIASYVRMYQQAHWMPSFAVLWGDYACMTGNHAAAWIADAWFKGIRDFDLKAAYAGLRKNSLDATLLPWLNGPRTPLDDFYNAHGYLPALHPGEQETEPKVSHLERRQAVSVTLENSFDDWCIAQLAGEAGEAGDRDLFLRRAAFYRNVFRADRGRMWPKDAQGQWIEPFDPGLAGGQGGRDYFTENNGYTYDWDVKQDFAGLFRLMGGPREAEAKLDQLFRQDLGLPRYQFFDKFPDSTGMVGEFSMGNEPSFVIPYLYDYLGSPWKTQKRIRMLLDTWFTDSLLGMPGDEDGGGMSAFVVFSMMGFYPTVPGVPVYCLGSPVFDRVALRMGNGAVLRIETAHNSAENKYIQAVRVNGRPTRRVWFRHQDIAAGGTIELVMGDAPNRSLGAKPEDFPPSDLSLRPAAIP